MKAFTIFLVLIVAAVSATENVCYSKTLNACSTKKGVAKKGDTDKLNCDARYGAIDKLNGTLQEYARAHLTRSFEYLLMSTHYGNFEKNREGFQKLFRDRSDYTWEKTIELIKYITKRGDQMVFMKPSNDATKKVYELHELHSLARALDMEKEMAIKAFHIHESASSRTEHHHDPEISSYLEKEFMHEQADTIRKFSGYTTDLTQLLRTKDSSLALFMFDEYLKKE